MPQYADKVTGSQTPVSNFSVKLEPVELMSTCTSDDVQRGGMQWDPETESRHHGRHLSQAVAVEWNPVQL